MGIEYTQQNVARFKTWFIENGGYIHPDATFKPVSSGFCVVSAQDIPADTPIVSCPFSLAVTPDFSRRALRKVLQLEDLFPGDWSERQLICTYLSLHSIVDDAGLAAYLIHQPYLSILPSSDKLRTSLHFTPAELELFRGTNLYGATLDRQKEWRMEWDACRDLVATVNPKWAEKFTWERYLMMATYLSSRAFPSTLLSPNPSLVSTSTSYPVLLPGVDSLNHARAQPVSWIVTYPQCDSNASIGPPSVSIPPPSVGPTISLLLHTATPSGTELFNNYGPKPNAELILGYGFSSTNNLDDTIVLKIGGLKNLDRKWEVGRDGAGAEHVWDAVLTAVRAQDRHLDEQQMGEGGVMVEDELWATEVLDEMSQDLLGRLPPVVSIIPGGEEDRLVRSEVLEMFDNYLEGQRDILHSLIEFAKQKEQKIIEKAKEAGIDIIDED